MLKRYFHKRERHFAMLNDNRIVRPFEWGTEFITDNPNSGDPRELFSEYSKNTIANSDEFFFSPEIEDYALSSPPFKGGVDAASADGVVVSSPLNDISAIEERTTPSATTPSDEASATPPKTGGELKGHPSFSKEGSSESAATNKILTWTSGVTTPSPENNTAFATWFPHETNKRSAVIVLPHWNAQAGTYFDLCKFFNKVGLSALRLTLPYHEERMPPELERADYLVAPNVGRTLQSLQQSVVDTRSAVRWLKQQGYEKVGVVGTSIGSCVGFFAFVHDMTIDAAVFNHVSGYPADIVWQGLSTYHVKLGIGDNLELDDLREYWLPISPMAYMDKLASLPPRPQRYIYTLYDLSFPVDLSRDVIRELNRRKIKHSESAIPCGHYTLGTKPWVYLDGYKIISYLRKHLK